MLYTVLGAVLFGLVSHFTLKMCGVDCKSSGMFPSNGSLIVFLCTIIGGGIGFGYGSAMLLNGRHIFNRLLG